MANLLLIGGSRSWSADLPSALRVYGVEPGVSRWVETPAACGIALLEAEWDVALCFADGTSLIPAVAPLLEHADRPQLVVVTEAPSAALTAEALRHGASLCVMPADIEPLAESVRRAVHAAGLRRRQRHVALFDEGQRIVLERIAQGAPLPQVLDLIVGLVEGREQGLICSVLLLDDATQTIRLGSAPHLPAPYNRAIDGLRIGPSAGSCGAAAFRGEVVIAQDIATHPNWEAYRDIALPYDLRACWSTPIFSPEGKVLGTFAMYHRAPHRPTDEERGWVAMATRLASIAILRDRDVQEIRRSEARFRQLLQTTLEGVITVDRNSITTFVNQRMAEMLGYSMEELLGRNITPLIHPEDQQFVFDKVQKRLAGYSGQYTTRFLKKNGDVLWVIVAGSPITSDGAVVGALAMITDITELKRAEAAQLERDAQFRAIFENAALGILLVGGDGRVLQVNTAFARFVGRTPAVLVGARFDDFVQQEGPPAGLGSDTQFVRADGAQVWGKVSRSPGLGGERQASVVIVEDVTESRAREAAVRSEELVRRMIYDAVSDIIFSIAVEPGGRYRFVLVNPAFLKATGLAEDHVVGRLVEEVIPPASLAAVRDRYREAVRERRTVRWEEVSEYPSGTRHGDVAITPVFDAAGVCTNLVGTVHDVTPRREAEAKIAKQAELLDLAKDAIIVRGTDDVVRFWNAGAMRLYGWTSEEAVGRSILELIYHDTGAYAEARRHIVAHGEWSGEIKQWTKSGRELVVETSWTLVRDAEGRPEAVLAINTDVTDKKRLQAEVALAQRMDSLGVLAGGIAHDFNNLLSAIIGHLGLAIRELPPDHRTRRRLDTVREAANRATDLVKQILTFSRRHEPRRSPARLQPIVEEALKLLRSTLPAMMDIRTQFAPEAFDVLVDSSQIHQVVMNLGTNAAHAMGSHGALEVRLAPVTWTSRLTGIASEAPPGRYMRLSVRDNGCGMDEATILRIFDPFFTTKNAGGGTGLGLFVVLGIVKEHGGVINVTSRPNEGSMFEIHLPEALSATRETGQSPSLHAMRGHGERLFIVDDEASVVAFLAETLAGLGYEVSSFTDPNAALNVFKGNPTGVDALVSDYAMPGMTGTELARAFHLLRPPLPIFMTSGYLRPDEAEEARRAGVQAVLQKPDFIEELARKLVERFAPA